MIVAAGLPPPAEATGPRAPFRPFLLLLPAREWNALVVVGEGPRELWRYQLIGDRVGGSGKARVEQMGQSDGWSDHFQSVSIAFSTKD